METEITIDTIEELSERWEYLKWQRGESHLLITEHFSKNEEKSYVVNGLTMETEEEFAMCYDKDNILANGLSLLMFFLKQCLTRIRLLPIENGYREFLELGNDGVIYIEIEN